MRSSVSALTHLLILIVALHLGACQNAPEVRTSPGASSEFPHQVYRQLQTAEGQVYRLDPKASQVRIHVYRGGKLAAQGHNHVILAPEFEGAAFLPRDGLEQARFDLVVPVERLEVDPPAVRAEIGGSFATEADDKARSGTRSNMLSAAVLDAERFPRFSLNALEVAGELPKIVARTAITVRGVTREQWLPMDVQLDADGLVVTGALAISQRDFGIEPFSALGGLLRVQDQLLIEFRLVGRAR